MEFRGRLELLQASYNKENSKVSYALQLEGCPSFDINHLIGKPIKLTYFGSIRCRKCGLKTKKSWQSGYCFPCSRKLPECDICMVRPEKCHYSQGTCRDESYAQSQCFQRHILYLAKSDIIKVGITRENRYFKRWMNQGAVEAMPVAFFSNRLEVGLAEVMIAKHMKDRANWRKMLKGCVSEESFDFYLNKIKEIFSDTYENVLIEEKNVFRFDYPVQQYPEKIHSLKLDKVNEIDETLLGIKGQYLLFDNKVFNVRAHCGYEISFYSDFL